MREVIREKGSKFSVDEQEGSFLWMREVTREKESKFSVDERSNKGERKGVFCG